MKTMLLSIFLLIALLGFCRATNKEDFRGFKLGSEFPSAGDSLYSKLSLTNTWAVYGDPDNIVKYYRLVNDNLTLSDEKLTSIEYGYFDNKLWQITITGKKEKYTWKYVDMVYGRTVITHSFIKPELVATMEYIYGKAKTDTLDRFSNENFDIIYSWRVNNVIITLTDHYGDDFGFTQNVIIKYTDKSLQNKIEIGRAHV